MALVLAHLSDLHVSRYGEHVTSLQPKLRSRTGGRDDEAWERVDEVDGWLIQKRVRRRWPFRDPEDGVELRVLDEAGYVQLRRKGQTGAKHKTLSDLHALIAERHLTEHSRLARAFPSEQRVDQLLEEDPSNTNLLFCRAAHVLRRHRPDWILVTGDVTDDGIGFDLVQAAFEPFLENGRLLAIPGNHDVYGSPPLVVPPHERKDVKRKRELWAPFAEVMGVRADAPWVKELGEGVVVCALDSCNPAWTPLSASGEVREEALGEVASAVEALPGTCRLGMVHHHVVNPPILFTGRAPWQLGMRLRNAKEVYEFAVAHQFAAMLNGHRHLGYRFHPAYAPMFISAPSATLGCRTGAPPYYWRLEIVDRAIHSVHERALRPT